MSDWHRRKDRAGPSNRTDTDDDEAPATKGPSSQRFANNSKRSKDEQQQGPDISGKARNASKSNFNEHRTAAAGRTRAQGSSSSYEPSKVRPGAFQEGGGLAHGEEDTMLGTTNSSSQHLPRGETHFHTVAVAELVSHDEHNPEMLYERIRQLEENNRNLEAQRQSAVVASQVTQIADSNEETSNHETSSRKVVCFFKSKAATMAICFVLVVVIVAIAVGVTLGTGGDSSEDDSVVSQGQNASEPSTPTIPTLSPSASPSQVPISTPAPSPTPTNMPTQMPTSFIATRAPARFYQSCLPPDASFFEIEDSVDIGDVLFDTDGPGGTTSCGDRCYTVVDNGDKPPYEPREGDTAHFAYRAVSSNNFILRARICGYNCEFCNFKCEAGESQVSCGRIGFMVRTSLEPTAVSRFISFTPFRSSNTTGWDPDGPIGGSRSSGGKRGGCVILTLTRDGASNRTTFTTTYLGIEPQGCDGEGETPGGSSTSSGRDYFPKDVLVGLAVSTPVSFKEGEHPIGMYHKFTEADFRDVEFYDLDA